jgi:hypothetical protein
MGSDSGSGSDVLQRPEKAGDLEPDECEDILGDLKSCMDDVEKWGAEQEDVRRNLIRTEV